MNVAMLKSGTNHSVTASKQQQDSETGRLRSIQRRLERINHPDVPKLAQELREVVQSRKE